MVTRAEIKELGQHDGQTVELHGWVRSIRKSGKVAFLQLRDGTGTCQCVVEAARPEAFAAAQDLTQESSLVLTGEVRADDRAEGGYEIAVTTLSVLQLADEFPIARKSHGIDFLMEHRHLWLRSRRPTAILRIRHTVIRACRQFFDEGGFTLIDTPILVGGAGEDDQSLFPVEYFDRQAYLAQTGQLHLETACMALGKVYCFGPTFRAEKSKTRRHLTEFWMIEPEIAFADLDDVVALAEDMICYVVKTVLEQHREELEQLGRDVTALEKVTKPFPRITYSEAVEMLRSDELRATLEQQLEDARRELADLKSSRDALERQAADVKKAWKQEKLKGQIRELDEQIEELERHVTNRPKHIELARAFEWGKDLGGSDETILSEQFDRPVFVTDYPIEAKAFYMKRSRTDGRVVRNMDLLAPQGYGEIIGGSQREDDLDILIDMMEASGLTPSDYDWYLDLRRYGSVPHGGFGLGIERAITWICGLQHVRETIPFPRTMGRLHP